MRFARIVKARFDGERSLLKGVDFIPPDWVASPPTQAGPAILS